MHELSVGFNEVSVEQRLSDLKTEITAQIKKDPQGGDHRIKACNAAFNEVFERAGLDDIFLAAFENRPDLNAVHADALALRAVQKHALRRTRELNYPGRFDTPQPWIDLVTDILHAKPARREFRHDMLHNSVQTNIAERGKSVKLLSLLMASRFERPLSILEIGCGQNHLLKMLALDNENIGFNYQPIKVKKPLPGHLPGSLENIDDLQTTAKLNNMLSAGRLALGNCMGIDKESNKRRSNIEWVRSQFYPSEYLDPMHLEEFDLVEAARLPNVRFRRMDVLEMDLPSPQLEAVTRKGPYDIVLYSTMLYQLSERHRETAEQVASRLVNKETGIKIYQDFASINPDNPNRLNFYKHWGPYTYRTIIEDVQRPGKKEVLFIWKRGRCDELQIGPAEICHEDTIIKAVDLLAA